MVRREDDREAGLRAAGAEVVVGDLLERADVYRVVNGCRRVYFGMSVSAGYLKATVTMTAEHPEHHSEPSAAAALAERAGARVVRAYQQGRQRRPLRRVGTAAALRGGAARGVPIASLRFNR